MPTPQIALNYLTPNRGIFTIVELPKVSFNVTAYGLPSIELPPVTNPSPLYQKALFGSKLLYGNLVIEFLVDENLENYLEIHDWMRGLGAPSNKEKEHKPQKEKLIYGNANLIINSSHNNPVIDFQFIELTPISLSGLNFSEENQETVVMKATVEFAILRYDINRKP